MTRKTLNLLYAIGRPLSPLYSLIMRARSSLYKFGIFKKTKLSVPVVSIGNLTMGGTGITPMVMYVSRLLQKKGLQHVIVSRGYGGKATKAVNIVSDGKEILLSADIAGDEPRMIAESLQGIGVLTGPRKIEVAKYAVDEFNAQGIVLDDGFQHMALERDLNLVVFNAWAPLGNGHVFPGGDLREPINSLSRAHAFIISGVDKQNVHHVAELKDFLESKFPGVPIFEGRYANAGTRNSLNGKSLNKQTINSKKLFGFCGIANPEIFENSLKEEGVQLLGFQGFKDHYRYSKGDFTKLVEKAKSVGADALITTEKDIVKVGEFLSESFPVFVFQRNLIMDKAFDLFLFNRVGL